MVLESTVSPASLGESCSSSHRSAPRRWCASSGSAVVLPRYRRWHWGLHVHHPMSCHACPQHQQQGCRSWLRVQRGWCTPDRAEREQGAWKPSAPGDDHDAHSVLIIGSVAKPIRFSVWRANPAMSPETAWKAPSQTARPNGSSYCVAQPAVSTTPGRPRTAVPTTVNRCRYVQHLRPAETRTRPLSWTIRASLSRRAVPVASFASLGPRRQGRTRRHPR